MKKLSKILALVLVLGLLVFALAACGGDDETPYVDKDGVRVEILEDDDGVKYGCVASVLDGAPEDLVVPAFVLYKAPGDDAEKEIPVRVIGSLSFEKNKLKSITIPESVNEIKAWACTYSDTISSVVIKGDLKSIGEYAFYNCPSLKSVTLEGSTVPVLGNPESRNTENTVFQVLDAKNKPVFPSDLKIYAKAGLDFSQDSSWNGYKDMLVQGN